MSLRSQVMRGGVFLALRQAVGLALSLGGMLLVTSAIGPKAFGIYSGVTALMVFLLNVGQWGINVYLVRKEGELQDPDLQQAFWLLLLLGGGITLLSCSLLPLIALFNRQPEFVPVGLALFPSLLLQILATVPLARLERSLDYRRIAWVELAAQATFLLLAFPLARAGYGVWAPVLGWWGQQLLTAIAFYALSPVALRWRWDQGRSRAMLGYGLGFSLSTWVWLLRNLVSPLVVGRFAGAEAVGYVNMAIRLVEMLGFVKTVAWRIAIAALGRVQGDRAKLVEAINEGMRLQVLSLGPFLLGFALLGYWIIPLVMNPKWLPVMQVFPFVALGLLVQVLFALHSSALYVLGRNWAVMQFHLLHIAVFVGSALLLVPGVGLIGYGWAELIALAPYGLLHLQFSRLVGSPHYGIAGLWAAAFGLALFWKTLGWWAFIPLLLVLAWPQTWQSLGRYWRMVRA
jgi:PST family polysaccharide transporter